MLIKHSMIYLAAKLLPGAMGMLTTALLTHLLDPRQYGIYGLSLVVMSFGSTMLFDWMGVSFLRFYQKRKDDPIVIDTFAHIFLAVVSISAMATAIAWLFGAFQGAEAAAIGIGIFLMWAYSWFELSSRFEIANFRPMKYFTMNFGRAVFIILGAGTAAWLTHNPIWTGIGTAIGTASGALLGGFTSWRLGRRHFDTPLARAVLAFGLPMAASMTLNSLINNGIRALIDALGSPEALGLYTAAYMLVQNTLTVAASGISAASYSLAVRAVESGDPVAARRQLLANSSLLLALLAPASLGMALTAPGIAHVMVGPQFVASVTTLTPWMALGAFFANFRAHHLDHSFQLGHRPMLQVWVTALAAAVGLGLSLYLIPRIGPVGAAISVAVAMAISCVHAFIAGHSAYPMPFPVANFFSIALACAAMAVVVLLVPGQGLPHFILQVVLGAATYAAVVLAVDLLDMRSAALAWIRKKSSRAMQ